MLSWEAEGPRIDFFFSPLNFFKRGSEPNGEEQGQGQQQLNNSLVFGQ